MAVKKTYSLDRPNRAPYSAASCRKRFLGSGEVRGEGPTRGEGRRDMTKSRVKFSLSLVAVIVLIALVVGVVGGRASGGSSSSSGGGAGGKAAGKKVDVIIKASDSSFWQTMLAGASKAGGDYGLKVGLFGPDLGDRHQPAGPADRELDLARGRRDRPRVELVQRAQQRDQARPPGRDQGHHRRHGGHDRRRGLHRHRQRQGRRAGRRAHVRARQAGRQELGRHPHRVLGGRHPDAQGPRRAASAPACKACPGLRVATHALQQQRPQHGGQPGQRRRSPPTRASSGSSPTTTPRAPAPRAPSRTTRPPTASRSSPSTPTRRRTRP